MLFFLRKEAWSAVFDRRPSIFSLILRYLLIVFLIPFLFFLILTLVIGQPELSKQPTAAEIFWIILLFLFPVYDLLRIWVLYYYSPTPPGKERFRRALTIMLYSKVFWLFFVLVNIVAVSLHVKFFWMNFVLFRTELVLITMLEAFLMRQGVEIGFKTTGKNSSLISLAAVTLPLFYAGAIAILTLIGAYGVTLTFLGHPL